MQPDTVADVCAGWLKRHVEAKGLRTGYEVRRVIERYVLPRWRDRPFAEIRRSDVAALLDAVEDKHGPWVADQVLAALGSVASWFATGTTITCRPSSRACGASRRRRASAAAPCPTPSWYAFGTRPKQAGVFGAFVHAAVMTAQRRDKVADHAVVGPYEGDIWTIASRAAREG